MALFDWFTADRADVREAYEDLRFMLRRGDEMFAAATARLVDNEILDVNLGQLDEEINDRERHLRLVVRDNLKSRPEHQLVDLLKLLGIVHEAERIGDLAKTIARVAELADGPRMVPTVIPFRDVRDAVVSNFRLTRESFDGHIVSRAEEVLERHASLKQEVWRLVSAMAGPDGPGSNEAVVLSLGARMMGRVSSHLANIASAVVLPYEDLRRSRSGGIRPG